MTTMLPRLPTLNVGTLIIRTRAQILAENDARANAARDTAHVVSAAEQCERERRARSAPKARSAAPVAPAAPKAPKLVATLATLAGDTRSVFEDGSVLPTLVATLRSDSTLLSAKLASGVCLSLWEGDVCIKRVFYVHAAAAYAAGEAASEADRYTVSDVVTRGEVLAGDRPLARDTVTPSRERPSCKRMGSVYGGNHQWNMSAKQSRAIFSHG